MYIVLFCDKLVHEQALTVAAGHLAFCDKTYLKHHDLSFHWWEVVVYVHQSYSRALAINSQLGILEGIFVLENSNTMPGPSPGNSWNNSVIVSSYILCEVQYHDIIWMMQK